MTPIVTCEALYDVEDCGKLGKEWVDVRFQYPLERLEVGIVESPRKMTVSIRFLRSMSKKSQEIFLKKVSAIFYSNRGPQVMMRGRNCGTNLAEM